MSYESERCVIRYSNFENIAMSNDLENKVEIYEEVLLISNFDSLKLEHMKTAAG